MMGRMTELWQLGALELAGKIATKEVSSREVVESHLARVLAGERRRERHRPRC